MVLQLHLRSLLVLDQGLMEVHGDLAFDMLLLCHHELEAHLSVMVLVIDHLDVLGGGGLYEKEAVYAVSCQGQDVVLIDLMVEDLVQPAYLLDAIREGTLIVPVLLAVLHVVEVIMYLVGKRGDLLELLKARLQNLGRLGKLLDDLVALQLILVVGVDQVNLVSRVNEKVLINTVELILIIKQGDIVLLYLNVGIPYFLEALRILTLLQRFDLLFGGQVITEIDAIYHIYKHEMYHLTF